ncbi:MAG: sigma-70 family RNA polymerase sigma factor [Saprospiraceae bacterium]|nr:sigma-70 family RNA polymerase sigma factor [Saprospiraceae bacterium]
MQATQTAQLADQELIDLYLNGNEKAFEILLRRHKARIYTSIYIFCKDAQLAEDIFQEVFIKIINTLRSGRYNHEGKFLQWALRISHNLCVDYFRRDKRRPTMGQTDEYDIFNVIGLSDESPEQNIMRSQTHERIRHLVDSLPIEQREVVVLRHYADMSFKEIASLTRVSINTALGRMRYALINMRRMVEEKDLILQ